MKAMLLVLLLAGCSSALVIDPTKVRTFFDPDTGIKCYELIDRDGTPHFACLKVTK